MAAVALSAHFLVPVHSRITKSGQEPIIGTEGIGEPWRGHFPWPSMRLLSERRCAAVLTPGRVPLVVMRWTPALRQVAMRESCSYKRPRNRSSHEAVSAE